MQRVPSYEILRPKINDTLQSEGNNTSNGTDSHGVDLVGGSSTNEGDWVGGSDAMSGVAGNTWFGGSRAAVDDCGALLGWLGCVGRR